LKLRHRIGERIQQEQQLSTGAIQWIVCIAAAILRAFEGEKSKNMSTIAQTMGVSRTTLYHHLRLAVEALNWVYQSKQQLNHLHSQLHQYQHQYWEVQHQVKQAGQTIQEYWLLLCNGQEQLQRLEALLEQQQDQKRIELKRLIVVLRLSGRCTIRSIMEVLQEGLGLKVSEGYVYNILSQARAQAKVNLAQMWEAMPLSGAIAIDEVFLREWGKRIYGVVVVDPITGLIWRLDRVRSRSHAAMGEVLKGLSEEGLKHSLKLCLTDMYRGYEKLVATYFPFAAHQFCWFHINCFHIGAMVRRAKSGYRRAQKELKSFEHKHPSLETKALKRKGASLTDNVEQAHRFWLGAQRFQRILDHCVDARCEQQATEKLERLIRVGRDLNNPYIQEMTTFLERHRLGLLSFFSCLDKQPLQQPACKDWWTITPSTVSLLKQVEIPKTTNAAEHIFRCLRRYLHGMDHVGNNKTTQEFFDLFAFFHNVRTLRAGPKAGRSLLGAAGVKVDAIFGSDDPYTILGFPPTFKTVIPLRVYKKVSSQVQNQLVA
jgi:hypothetical protein